MKETLHVLELRHIKNAFKICRGEGGGEVDKNFRTVSWGWGEICFPCIPCILERGGGQFLGG